MKTGTRMMMKKKWAVVHFVSTKLRNVNVAVAAVVVSAAVAVAAAVGRAVAAVVVAGGGGGGTRRHGSFNRVCWGKKTRRAKGKSGL